MNTFKLKQNLQSLKQISNFCDLNKALVNIVYANLLSRVNEYTSVINYNRTHKIVSADEIDISKTLYLTDQDSIDQSREYRYCIKTGRTEWNMYTCTITQKDLKKQMAYPTIYSFLQKHLNNIDFLAVSLSSSRTIFYRLVEQKLYFLSTRINEVILIVLQREMSRLETATKTISKQQTDAQRAVSTALQRKTISDLTNFF